MYSPEHIIGYIYIKNITFNTKACTNPDLFQQFLCIIKHDDNQVKATQALWQKSEENEQTILFDKSRYMLPVYSTKNNVKFHLYSITVPKNIQSENAKFTLLHELIYKIKFNILDKDDYKEVFCGSLFAQFNINNTHLVFRRKVNNCN